MNGGAGGWLDGAGWMAAGLEGAMRGGGGGCGKGGWMEARRMEDGWVRSWKVGMEGLLDGGGWMGWRVEEKMDGGAGLGEKAVAWMEGRAWGSGLDGGMEGAGRGGVEGWRGLSGWRDRTAQTEPHKPNCKKNRTETKAKPIPETETNRNEPRLYCIRYPYKQERAKTQGCALVQPWHRPGLQRMCQESAEMQPSRQLHLGLCGISIYNGYLKEPEIAPQIPKGV